MNRLGRFGTCASIIFGCCVGSFAFLTVAALFLGKPIRDSIISAHGILVATKPTRLTFEQNETVMYLLQKGALISSSDLLASVSSFYSAVIQVLIGTFFVFGVLSYFIVRAHSRMQVEEVADSLVTAAAGHHFNSVGFHKQISEGIDSALQIELESYSEQTKNIDEMNDRIQELEARIKEVAEAAKPEKKEEDE